MTWKVAMKAHLMVCDPLGHLDMQDSAIYGVQHSTTTACEKGTFDCHLCDFLGRYIVPTVSCYWSSFFLWELYCTTFRRSLLQLICIIHRYPSLTPALVPLLVVRPVIILIIKFCQTSYCSKESSTVAVHLFSYNCAI